MFIVSIYLQCASWLDSRHAVITYVTKIVLEDTEDIRGDDASDGITNWLILCTARKIGYHYLTEPAKKCTQKQFLFSYFNVLYKYLVAH